MREYNYEDITKYKNKFKLQWADFSKFLEVSRHSINMWTKGYPKPDKVRMAKLHEMYDLLDEAQPKQRWQAFGVLGFGDDYEG